jgi:hypothetical protein
MSRDSLKERYAKFSFSFDVGITLSQYPLDSTQEHSEPRAGAIVVQEN